LSNKKPYIEVKECSPGYYSFDVGEGYVLKIIDGKHCFEGNRYFETKEEAIFEANRLGNKLGGLEVVIKE